MFRLVSVITSLMATNIEEAVQRRIQNAEGNFASPRLRHLAQHTHSLQADARVLIGYA